MIIFMLLSFFSYSSYLHISKSDIHFGICSPYFIHTTIGDILQEHLFKFNMEDHLKPNILHQKLSKRIPSWTSQKNNWHNL